eukprot:COSAG06_NODE_17872_length_916_cov_2.833537_1_plen_31_part_01
MLQLQLLQLPLQLHPLLLLRIVSLDQAPSPT